LGTGDDVPDPDPDIIFVPIFLPLPVPVPRVGVHGLFYVFPQLGLRLPGVLYCWRRPVTDVTPAA